jgi:hypothetical protein
MSKNFGPRVETQVFASGTRTTRRPGTPLALAWALLERIGLEQAVQDLTVQNANLNIGLASMARRLAEAEASATAAEQRVDELEALHPGERVTRNMRAVQLIDSGECEDKIVIDDPAAWDGVDTTEVVR